MTEYIAVVHKDEQSAWGLYFPDVPGCFSAADDERDLRKNAIEALAGNVALRDTPPPVPRSIEELMVDEDVKGDLLNGAVLMYVPLLDQASRSVRFNMSMNAALLSAVDEHAKQRGMTRSGYLADLAAKDIALFGAVHSEGKSAHGVSSRVALGGRLSARNEKAVLTAKGK